MKEEWHPQPSDLQVSTSTDMDNDTNKQETPIIDTASSAPCNRSIILTGLPPTISQSNAKDELEKLLEGKDKEDIVDITYKAKGVALITFKDWAGCKYISEKYKKAKINEKQIFFTLYSESDPNTQ